MILIQRAGVEDIQAMLPLVQEYWNFEDISGFKPEKISTQLYRLFSESQLGSGWIAYDNGHEVGYLLAVYVFSLEHLGITAEIDEFFILPSYRSRGIGEKILRVAESEFRNNGCTNVSLQISKLNSSAREFYIHQQFKYRAGYELLDKTL